MTMLTVEEVQKCALTENDIFASFYDDLVPFNASRTLARRLGAEMLRIGALMALENLCSGRMSEDSGVISLNTYPFGKMTGKRCPEFFGVCTGSRRLYGVFKAIERQLDSYKKPNNDYEDWETRAKSITVFTDKWDPKYLEMYESLYINAILQYSVYFNFYLVTPYGISRIPFMNRQQVQNIKKSFGKQDVVGTLFELISKCGIREAELRISTCFPFLPNANKYYHFDFENLVYEFSDATGEKKTGKLNEILAKRFLRTAVEMNNAGVLNKVEHVSDGEFYDLDLYKFKLEWVDVQAGSDPYAGKMEHTLCRLLDSLD